MLTPEQLAKWKAMAAATSDGYLWHVSAGGMGAIRASGGTAVSHRSSRDGEEGRVGAPDRGDVDRQLSPAVEQEEPGAVPQRAGDEADHARLVTCPMTLRKEFA